MHFLYTLQSTSPNVAGAYSGSLDGAPASRILESDQKVEFAPPDQLIFARESQLFAQPFDLGTLRTRGAPTRVADRVSVVSNFGLGRGGAEFSVSNTGPLIVVHGGTGDDEFELGVFDRNGRQVLLFDADRYVGVELSADGNRLAVHRHTADGGDLWITDLQTKADRRFTFEPSEDAFSSVWSPDGTMIAFAALRSGRWGVYSKPANGGGTAELLYESAKAAIPMAWAPDGQAIVLVNYASVAQDLWILPLSGDRQPKVYFQSAMAVAHPQVSPDGRWISYTSFSTSRVGTREVWVQSYPVPGIKYQVPLAFARQARWRADGKELFVVTSDALTAVPIESTGSALAFGPPTELFKATRFGLSSHRSEGFNFFEYDVSADGQTFVLPSFLAPGNAAGSRPPMTVILNWRSLLAKKVGPPMALNSGSGVTRRM